MPVLDPVRASAASRVDDVAFTLCLASFAAALVASSVPVLLERPETLTTVVNTRSAAPSAGTFTGAYVDGAPVYRLPPIRVTGSREIEMARVERDGAPAPATAFGGPVRPPASPMPLVAGRG